MKNKEQFLKALTEGVVTVEFRKIGTNELRVMPCTLDPETSGGKVQTQVGQVPDSEHYAVWCLDKDSWRSFRCDTVENWYEGYPTTDEAELHAALDVSVAAASLRMSMINTDVDN